MLKRRGLGQTGDTIVEVLLCIAVVSSVLGGAFASAQKSQQVNRRSQERAEALQLVQAQVERLKAAVTSGTMTTPVAGNPIFCFNGANAKTPIYTGVSPSIGSPTWPNLSADNFNNYKAPECKNGSAPFNLSTDYIVATKTYVFRARWDKAGGGGRDELVVRYRTGG